MELYSSREHRKAQMILLRILTNIVLRLRRESIIGSSKTTTAKVCAQIIVIYS